MITKNKLIYFASLSTFLISLLSLFNNLLSLDLNSIFERNWFPYNNLLFLSLLFIFILLLSKFKRNIYFLTPFILISIVNNNIINLFYLLIIFIINSVIGISILDILKLNFTCLISKIIHSFFTGLFFISLIIYFLSFYKINYFEVYFFFTFTLILLFITVNKYNLIIPITITKNFLFNEVDISFSKNFFLLLLILLFSVSLMPENGFDALNTHLYIPSYINFNHIFEREPQIFVTGINLPFADFYYTYLNILFPSFDNYGKSLNILVILILVSYSYILINYFNNRINPYFFSIYFISLPIIYLYTTSSFVDLLWASFLVISLSNLIISFNSNTRNIKINHFYISILFFIFSIYFKLISLFYLPLYVYIFFIYRRFILFKIEFRIKFLVSFILFIIPFIYPFLKTNNPFFPFFNNYFRSEFFPHLNPLNNLYRGNFSLHFLKDITFKSHNFLEAYPGAIGLSFYLLLPSAIIFYCKNNKFLILLFLFFISFFLTIYFQFYLRYLLPLLIISSFLIFLYSFNFFTSTFSKCILVFLIISNLFFIRSATHYGYFSYFSFINGEYIKEYEVNNNQLKNIISYINNSESEKLGVLFLSEPTAGNLKFRAFYNNWQNRLFESLVANFDPYLFNELLVEYDIKYIIVKNDFINHDIINFLNEKSSLVVQKKNYSLRIFNVHR